MTLKEQLIKEIEDAPDYLAKEILNFCLFLKAKIKDQETKTTESDLPEFLDFIDEITKEVPLTEWKKLPSDLSKNIDHYLYGIPKIEP